MRVMGSEAGRVQVGRISHVPLVGREREMARLRALLAEAREGRGVLALLVGEPGIGKTRTTQELETYAMTRGATVLWGRTHESSGAPPYWPWLQICNQLLQGFPELAGRLNLPPETVGELARLFPFLKSQPNYVEPRENLSPESAQFRLFDAYATFLLAVASVGDHRAMDPPLPHGRGTVSGAAGAASAPLSREVGRG